MNPVARRNARHYALQAMYQWQLSHLPIQEIEEQFIHYQIKKTIDLDYFKEIIQAVAKSVSELEAHIQPFLTRQLNDIDPIELGILRLATYELAYRLDIPYRVVINEALDLTKRFGSIEGYKFVNGVLDKIARNLRSVEVIAQKSK